MDLYNVSPADPLTIKCGENKDRGKVSRQTQLRIDEERFENMYDITPNIEVTWIYFDFI